MKSNRLYGTLLGSVGVSALLSGLLIAQQQPPPSQPPNQPNQPSPNQPNPNRPNDPNQPNPNRPNDPNQPGKPERPKTPNNTTASDRNPQQFRVERASQMIGKPIQNQQGEPLGQVQEFGIDPDNQNRVAYAVISPEKGTAGANANQWRAVPMSALKWGDGHYTFSGDVDRWRNAPGFEQNQWPRMDDPTWASKTHEYYNQEPYWTDSSQPSGDPRLRIERSSTFIGRTIQNKTGDNLGRLEDFAIDPDTGRIAYNVMSGTGSGSSSKYYAMPPDSITMSRTGRTATIDMDSDRLGKAPSFERDKWPNLADSTYGSTVYDYYGQRPYWTQSQTEQLGTTKTNTQPQPQNQPQRNP